MCVCSFQMHVFGFVFFLFKEEKKIIKNNLTAYMEYEQKYREKNKLIK